MGFENTSYLAQIKKLRTMADEILKQYPLKITSMHLVHYGENATFKLIDSKNKKYLLKIHREMYHTKQSLLEEHKWLQCLSKTTEICVPRLVLSIDQHTLVENQNAVPGFRYCDLFKWIEGRFVWKSINAQHVKKIGSLMGLLQKNGQKIKIYHRHYWHAEGLVGTNKAKFGNVEKLIDISKKDQDRITLARRNIYQKLFDFQKRYPEKLGLIHADLHFKNFLIQKEKVGVIDFDDCGTGFYGYDLIVPIFHLEYLIDINKSKDLSKLTEALYKGYAEHMPLVQRDLDMVPYFLGARKLCMLAWLQSRASNPRLRVQLQESIKRNLKYLQRIKVC